MDHLPQELLSDILLRLPVKSLFLLCCVSKKLYSFITSPLFVDEHLRHSQNNGGRRVLRLKERVIPFYSGRNLKTQLSTCRPDEDKSTGVVGHELELPFSDGLVVRLFGSCNGIVCISVASNVHLCNPTSRRYLTLPRFSFASNHAVTHGMGLGFEPVTQNYQVIRLVWFLGALELDPSTIHQDFEVMSLLTDWPPVETLTGASSSREMSARDWAALDQGSPSILLETFTQSSSSGILSQGWPTVCAEIYNLKTNSWRKLNVVLPHIDEKNRAAVLNGRYFHWCTKYGTILSFDMNTQTFRQMEIPIPVRVTPGVNQRSPAWNVGVLDDSLALLDESLALMFLSRKRIDVWVMEEYGRQEYWTRKYSIEVPIWSIGAASLSSWNDGKLFMVSDTESELISCCLGDHYGKINNYGRIFRPVNYSMAYLVYHESLVSLYRGHEGLLWQRM